MRTMKNSGVEWIGEIPSDWEVIRLKLSFISRDGGAWGDEKQENAEDRICLRIADFDYSRLGFKKKCEFTIRNYDKNTIDRLTLKKGDILIEKSGGGEKTPVGRSVIFEDDFPALYANFMDRLRCSEFVFPKWMLYLLSIFYTNGYVWNYIKQTTGIQNLDLTAMLNQEVIPLPPISTQQRIANFLDKKCGKIDEIIEREQAVIEKLKEYKQSVITEAVTKGLNPHAEMKDSGVEWIGKIPEHWEITKIKYVSNFNPSNGKTLLPSDEIGYVPMECLKNGYMLPKVIEYSKITSGLTYFETADIIMAKVTPCFENGNIAIAQKLKSNCAFGSSELFVFRSNHIIKEFLFYFLQNKIFKTMCISTMTGTGGLKRVSFDFIKNYKFALPNQTEQQQIVDYLDNKCAKIDKSIEAKQTVIDKLTEYKKSLIYEVVTGKKEI